MHTPAPQRKKLSFIELIVITAALMALNALAIDIMLPALGQIGDELHAARANDRQLIIVVYVIANGIAQLFFGPIVDRFGRKKVLIWSLAGYILGSIFSIFASSFSLLLVARAFQGITTAATRVASIAIVRDQCSGRRMAEVMSWAITIFMAAPILAPGIGQLILFVAPWRGIFIALALYALIIISWVLWKLPETLSVEDQKPLRAGPIAASYLQFIRNRIAIGYTMMSALCFGAVFAYISMSEQIFLEIFDLGQGFAFAFGAIAFSLGVATMLNAKLVSSVGMRRLSHGALAGFIITNLIHLAIVTMFGETLPVFMIFMSLSFFTIGLVGPNATAMAMEPMGHIAGAAAAVNGFAGTTIAGFLGGLIGQFYNGSTLPMILGFCILGTTALVIVLWAEKGVLFHPQTHGKDP